MLLLKIHLTSVNIILRESSFVLEVDSNDFILKQFRRYLKNQEEKFQNLAQVEDACSSVLTISEHTVFKTSDIF